MKRVKYTGNVPEYIDCFPKDCERSCKGSLHLLPNAIKDITEGEYEVIRKEYPKLRLQVLPKEKPPVKKLQPVKEPVKVSKEQSKKKADKKKK